MDDTLLSSSVTIKKYREFEADKEREQIADFIYESYSERYIKPLRGAPAKKHGFCIIEKNSSNYEINASIYIKGQHKWRA